MRDLGDIWQTWFKKEQEKLGLSPTVSPNKKRKRRYTHFDYRLNKLDSSLAQELCKPEKVASYPFYPFVRYLERRVKFKYNDAGDRYIVRKDPRPICYAAHGDALIFSWYGFQLAYFYELRLKELGIQLEPVGYRTGDTYRGKSNIDFAKDVFKFIETSEECAVLCLDIKGFFDNLDHGILKERWKSILPKDLLNLSGGLSEDHFHVFKHLTRYHSVNIEDLRRALRIPSQEIERHLPRFCDPQIAREILTKSLVKQNDSKRGIPQGAPLSATLSNIYMLEFDSEVSNYMKKLGGFYRRYSDDIIVVCPLALANVVERLLTIEIGKLKIEISSEKTERRVFKKTSTGFHCFDLDGNPSILTYLGIGFNGRNVYLRHKGIAHFQKKRKNAVWACAWQGWKIGKPLVGKKELLKKYAPIGEQNYLSYAKKVAKTFHSQTVRDQVGDIRAAKQLNSEIEKATKVYKGRPRPGTSTH